MITGPVKFRFKTGDIDRDAMAFWCVMIPRELFTELGPLDEIFSPGMGEDGDFCIKASLAGHDLVQVPIDGTHEFGTDPSGNIIIPDEPWKVFPIMHKGSGTFGWLDAGDLIEKNKRILDERYSNIQITQDTIMIYKNTKPKYSIIIPTYNHCDDLLKPCLESIIQYSDLSNLEVIVVANGCTDNTKEYVEGLGHPFKLIWIEEASGYTISTNVGIKASTGDYVILLNNDTVLLDQPKNKWIDMLEEPFTKKSVGLTGPLQLFDEYAGSDVLIFFCVMIKREVFDKVGYYNESLVNSALDAELNGRIIRSGHKLVLRKDIKVKHFWKTNFFSYLKRNFLYGFYRPYQKSLLLYPTDRMIIIQMAALFLFMVFLLLWPFTRAGLYFLCCFLFCLFFL